MNEREKDEAAQLRSIPKTMSRTVARTRNSRVGGGGEWNKAEEGSKNTHTEYVCHSFLIAAVSFK